MRIIGLDFGSKTVGVAVSDELLITAQGIEIVRRKSENKLRQTLARIEELIKEYNVEKIVLGFPKNMNFTDPDTNESAEFYVLEQTTIRGINYLLVTVDEEGDSDAFILKETQNEDDHNTIYEMVEDDKELEALAKIFAELMEDVDIEF